ncbi:HNH endonuclease [Bacillus phage Izhevsk]|uniref:HNH endonuclease n=1 Tax=Bacillus phage Izhevsk TaxID=2724322 RepID=A0A6H0X6G9_9CAUD|nr:HNH endonuclease [Bacillus phage Izhevsk]QIW89817.1 HNH endonuclease [Bacillus phage Izhevsk]
MKGIVEYGDSYEVSNLGNVRSIDRYVNSRHGQRFVKGITMSPSDEKGGYKKVRLKDSSKVKNYRVHRLIALAFLPNPNNLPEVNHKDGNKNNNSVENLEWSSRSDNVQHAFDNGLKTPTVKKVDKIDIITGEVICTYESLKDASKDVGLKGTTGITKALKKETQSAGGFKWAYH